MVGLLSHLYAVRGQVREQRETRNRSVERFSNMPLMFVKFLFSYVFLVHQTNI